MQEAIAIMDTHYLSSRLPLTSANSHKSDLELINEKILSYMQQFFEKRLDYLKSHLAKIKEEDELFDILQSDGTMIADQKTIQEKVDVIIYR